MANTFKTVTFAEEPASAGTPYVMYTAASGTTTVVLGLILTNIHTAAVTVDVQLVSDTANRNGANNLANGKAVAISHSLAGISTICESMFLPKYRLIQGLAPLYLAKFLMIS